MRVRHRCRALAEFVAKYMGDGVLVYFGYPQAHDDDAEQAVRAGLELIEAVGGLELPNRLQIRIGIATEIVVVGDILGSGEARERGVVGETPNLAARLQSLAEPDSVVIGQKTPTTSSVACLIFVTLAGMQSKAFPTRSAPTRCFGRAA